MVFHKHFMESVIQCNSIHGKHCHHGVISMKLVASSSFPDGSSPVHSQFSFERVAALDSPVDCSGFILVNMLGIKRYYKI